MKREQKEKLNEKDINKDSQYHEQYVYGARKISVKTVRVKNDKETGHIINEPKGINVLFFNKKGILIVSWHFVTHEKCRKIIYAYDNEKRLATEMVLLKETNELEQLNEYGYDSEGRIETEKFHSFFFDYDDLITEYKYIYGHNTETVYMSNSIDEDGNGVIYTKYDDQERIIESKTIRNNEFEDWEKIEYDDMGNIIREVSLDENEVETIIFPKASNPINNLTGIDSDSNNDTIYTYNEKGHWIIKVEKKNLEQYFYSERIIEYYD